MRVIPLAILCALLGATYWFGATVYSHKIERDIATRTNNAVATFKPTLDLDVDGRDVTLSGHVRDELSRADAIDAVDSVRGVRATRDNLSIMQAYSIYAKFRKGSDFVVSGTVDNEKINNILTDTIAPIKAESQLNTGARPLLNSGAKVALASGAVSMMNFGELWINEDEMKVKGEVPSRTTKIELEHFLGTQQNLIDPLLLVTDITVAPMPENCLALSATDSVNEVVLFEVDSDIVNERFFGAIRALVDLVQECAPDTTGNIIVEAHADQDGSEDYNLSLSKRRAENVVRQLLLEGLAEKHISKFAFGETRPVASNESHGDKLLNRRVEVRFITNSADQQTTNYHILSTQSAE